MFYFCCRTSHIFKKLPGRLQVYIQLTMDNGTCSCILPSYTFYKSHHYLPWKGGIVFRLSVCPGRFFSYFVGVTPPTVFITHKQNLYHLKAECLDCVIMGDPFFRTFPPPKFWRDRSLKQPKITNSNFWRGTSQVFWVPEWDIHIIWKPCFRSSARPTQFVQTSNILVRNEIWKCPRRRIPGKILAKTAKSNSFFFFFFELTCARGHGGFCALQPLVNV